MPQVSIVIPSYNHSLFLKDRLESIAQQTFKDWEAIIIDDNSTDNSVEIISKFITDNPNFKVKYFIVNETNSGSGYTSWQKGIELAETEYIWIAETDDYSQLTFLHELVEILQKNTSIVLAFCNSNYVEHNKKFLYDSSKRTEILKVGKEKYKVFNSKILLDSMPLNPLITNGSSVVFRKPSSKIPKSIFQHKQMSDLFLCTYLLKNSNFAFLNRNLNFFRRHEDSTTTKNYEVNQERLYEEMVFYSNFFKLSRVESKAIIIHFIKIFLFSKKTYRFFYKKPFRKLEGINQIEINLLYVKVVSFIFIKKIKCRLYP